MRNNGDGTFTDVTKEAGLDMWGPAFTASWVDYDGDGYLDLFVVNNLGGLFNRKTPNRLFHNNGDGTFTDVTAEAGLKTFWPTIGAVWGDFTNNGLPDLFISNAGRPQLFRNNGDGTFIDVSREAGIDLPAITSVCVCCDIDDDGWLDIVQFTWSRPHDMIYTLRTGHGPSGGTPLRIFHNNHDGTFTDIARDLGLDGCWGTMSGTVGDFNNDGIDDLVQFNIETFDARYTTNLAAYWNGVKALPDFKGGIAEQTSQALTNVEAVLRAGGKTLADVVKVNVYLTDMRDFQAMNQVYATFFPTSKPARSAVGGTALVRGARVEIECIAAMR